MEFSDDDDSIEVASLGNDTEVASFYSKEEIREIGFHDFGDNFEYFVEEEINLHEEKDNRVVGIVEDDDYCELDEDLSSSGGSSSLSLSSLDDDNNDYYYGVEESSSTIVEDDYCELMYDDGSKEGEEERELIDEDQEQSEVEVEERIIEIYEESEDRLSDEDRRNCNCNCNCNEYHWSFFLLLIATTTTGALAVINHDSSNIRKVNGSSNPILDLIIVCDNDACFLSFAVSILVFVILLGITILMFYCLFIKKEKNENETTTNDVYSDIKQKDTTTIDCSTDSDTDDDDDTDDNSDMTSSASANSTFFGRFSKFWSNYFTFITNDKRATAADVELQQKQLALKLYYRYNTSSNAPSVISQDWTTDASYYDKHNIV